MPYIIPPVKSTRSRPAPSKKPAPAKGAHQVRPGGAALVKSSPVTTAAPVIQKQTTEFYSKKHNMVLYHTTKCAMTTMKNYLQCDRVPLANIPKDARVICVVRHPVSRFISGFLTLRKINLMKIYEVRQVSPPLKNKIKSAPLPQAFEAALEEVRARGPFDTHLQPQTAYLGPSNTIQNEYAGSRSPQKVTYWVPIEHLTKFCEKTFGSAPPRKNAADKQQETQLKNYVKNHPNLAEKILGIYKEDHERYKTISENFKL
jgi:hypothetical protein